MTLWRPRTLHGQLALLHAAVITFALTVYSVVVYYRAVVEPDNLYDPSAAAEAAMAAEQLLATLAYALPITLALTIGSAYWVTRRALAPLDDVVAHAHALETRSLARRIADDPRATEEVGALVHALNLMFGRFERSVGSLRRFTADAAHELRTPLAFISSRLELALRDEHLREAKSAEDLVEAVRDGLEGLQELEPLLEGLLTLARSDAGELPLLRAQTTLAHVIEKVLEPYAALAVEREVVITSTLDSALTVSVDPLWLGRAVANIVDNAIKFARTGGRCDVRAFRTGQRAVIEVSDDGPGLSDSDSALIFERFFRSEAARHMAAGFGLGLPLAREIIEGHGGTIMCERRSVGACFTISLPLAVSAS